MLDFIKKLLGIRHSSGKGPADDKVRYDREKEIARSEDMKGRMTLAKSSETHKEILYYLAERDPDPKIREAVAKNESLPVQASALLASDKNEDVRMALAKRLLKLLPELDQDTQSQLYAHAVQALGTLALDEVIKIRKALSSALKDCANTPPKVAGQLARDVEREVSEPILRFCAALSDQDLLEILHSHPKSWAVQAIAGRDALSGEISHAVIEMEDGPAGKVLLENSSAEILEDTLHLIVEKSREFSEWQKPVAVRKNLPPEMARELAAFADSSVRELLTERQDFDEALIEEITEVFRRRLDFADHEKRNSDMTAIERVMNLEKDGLLGDEAISDAVGMGDKDFVYAALARLAGTSAKIVENIFSMQAGKPIVALSWKAGLSMRTAYLLEKEMGRLQPKELVHPKDGTDYPMSRDELLWHLEFLGLEALTAKR